MDRAKKMDSRANGEVTFTGATTEFQLKKGLTLLVLFPQLALFLPGMMIK
jgi:hypothetical protein